MRTQVAVAGRSVSAELRPGAGPWIALDAGLGGWSSYWKPVVARLPDLACVAWDRPGLGHSDEDLGLTTADEVAARWRDALLALGATPPYVLVGHSLGGHHVRAFAGTWPDEVCGLVLVDVSIARRPTGAVRRGVSKLLVRRHDPKAGVLRLLERMEPEDREPAERVLAGEQYARARAHELAHVDVRAKAVHHSLPAVPLEVLSGAGAELDQLPVARRVLGLDRALGRIHEAHRALAASVPGGRWQLVAGSSHHVPLDRPDEVAAAVRRTARLATTPA